MRKLFLAGALSLCMVLPAKAEESAEDDFLLEVCETIERIAYDLMGVRQMGLPMSKAMAWAVGGDGPREVGDLFRFMVEQAYSEPSYLTEEMKEQQRWRFANDMALACYKAARD